MLNLLDTYAEDNVNKQLNAEVGLGEGAFCWIRWEWFNISFIYQYNLALTFVPVHDKPYKMTCTPEASAQSGQSLHLVN